MSAQPFAGFNPAPSAWGYNWRTDESPSGLPQQDASNSASPHRAPAPPPPHRTAADPDVQLSHLPAALLGALKRDKKPFTYTPGGVDLSEVLNARLNKRMERRRRYCEERSGGDEGGGRHRVVVAPTYNTPLDMYSVENALEALEVQAELVVGADKSSSSPSRSATLPRNHTFRGRPEDDVDNEKGVTQSRAFRVLQIITDTEEPLSDKPRPHHQDEMRFTGIRDVRTIPSRFFHTLQKITGTDGFQEEEEEERRMQRVEAQPSVRPPFPPQSETSRPAQQQQQPGRPVADGLPSFGGAALKRPAAFLPIKTTPGSGFRHVRPPSSCNGPPSRSIAGTDF